ncbi:disease resistance protein RGA4-like [Hordeum vulgare subsp. vulgare]|uniref:Disease resistance R13L4/SHOC-2-like LRR domain-containing protein n=1 Tax=Hordeum vulgare subsp. vulgare TaxID=112509 RepID=M0VY48_HORVV|nr:disease resistance protein RGA4-like [Hordeum vulgare subsp. vulgare]
MEFAVAAFSAVAAAAVSKLSGVKGRPNADARSISDDLSSIKATMLDHADDVLRPMSFLRAEYFAQLRALACDIEDCIDCFNAKMMTDDEFATKIAGLKERSTETTDRIKRFGFIPPAQGAAAQEAAVAVPAEIHNLHSSMKGNRHGDYLNCLLYFCLFPPNYHVRTKPLIRRLTAEGLVGREQAAINNLEKFIESSIIRSTRTSNNGKVRGFQTTCDAIRQYISQRSISENFILLCDGAAELPEEHPRRLSVYPCANAQLNLPQSLSLLRTLAIFATGEVDPASYEALLEFSQYGLLRVLDLKECDHLSDGHIQAIYNQVLMKYLSIKSGIIDRVTREVGNLKQLETLDLSGSQQLVTVYKEVLLLPKLKHLLGKFQLSRTDTFSMPVLGWFHSELEQFLSGNKSMLETLAGFVTGKRYGFPQLMSLMKRLRKVKIWCKSDASPENLGVLSSAIMKFIRDGTEAPHLKRSLSIDFEACSREFVGEIEAVAGKLDSLKLRGQLRRLPLFVVELSALEELCLWSTGLSWEVIRKGLSFVGGLKYLKLIEDNLGLIDIWNDHLISIERLSIVFNDPMLTDITIQDGALPCLVSLHIICPFLLPGRALGIKIAHMTQLNEVALHPDIDVEIKDEWQRVVDGHTNRPVPILLSIEGP